MILINLHFQNRDAGKCRKTQIFYFFQRESAFVCVQKTFYKVIAL